MKTKYNPDGSLTNVRPSRSLRWSSDSDLARQVCGKLRIDFQVQFVEAAEQDGVIYVSGTAGKPDEWSMLRMRCWEQGYFFVGLNGRVEFPPPCYQDLFAKAIATLERFAPVTL